ncbi:EF-hand domain-containing protein [Allohahella sp. A8]|uniref:EF-hand domain-containing protein n=1 Tax=Allohahella sp. A8 TaxID=3141461 RepID=UPI003A80A271
MKKLMIFAAATALSTGAIAGDMKSNMDGESRAERMEQQSSAQSLEQSFNKLDQDGDGKISKDEARENPQVESQFSQLDVNGDGEIGRNEMMLGSGESTAAGQQPAQSMDQDSGMDAGAQQDQYKLDEAREPDSQ